MLAKIDKEKLRAAMTRQNHFNLSELAREVKVTPTTIYRLMQGGKGARFVTLKKLAAVLNVGMHELLEG